MALHFQVLIAKFTRVKLILKQIDMKRITTFFVLTFLTTLAFGQNTLTEGVPGIGTNDTSTSRVEMELSHSVDPIPAQGSVACANSGGGFTTENSYWRSYVLADFGVAADMNAVAVNFGYSFADNSGTDPLIDVEVNLYTTDAAFPTGTLTLIATGTAQINAAGTLSVVRADMDSPATVTAADEVVVEVKFADGSAFPVDTRIGQNDAGETAPSYISTPDCGGIAAITFTDLGFPGNAVINLVLDDDLSISDRFAAQVSVYPNPATDILNVSFPVTAEVTNFKIFNILGSDTGLELANGVVNTSSLARGIYMLSLETTEGNYTTKIVKQ